ncbi:MAG: type III pantothenate kinase [Rhodanobacter sp.]|jgi:type III pantothenate kinase|nr:type III pantothenate kinase [Rhodanobacter sp.]
MKLLLDLGNTRAKWALHQHGEVLAQGAVAWAGSVVDVLSSAWSGCPRPTAVFGASVVDDARERQVAACVAVEFGHEVTWLRTPAHACGVRNAYAKPQQLGVDRFLAMVAAHADGLSPCVLASVGTALTVDALAANGTHLGGLIAPGPHLMRQSLLGATAQVRPDRVGDILDLADNTADAVSSGCWQATAALVERFAGRMAPRLGVGAILALDGGDAAQLLSLLSVPARLTPDSVLRGLAHWADMHMSTRPPV